MNAMPSIIAAAIIDALAWAVVSPAMSDPQLLEPGAEELGRWIAERIDPQSSPDVRQFGLPL